MQMPKRRLLTAALGVFALASGLAAANIPRPAPDFTINLAGGSRITLAQYKGKVVALAFILTSCPHCQKAVRCLTRAQTEFGPSGFQALAAAVEDMAQIHVPEFVRQYNPNFPVGYDRLRPVLDFMQHPTGLTPLMPFIVFVDREGVIRAQYEGHEPFFAEDQMEKNIRAKIAEMLKNEASPPKKGIRKKAAHSKRQSRAAGSSTPLAALHSFSTMRSSSVRSVTLP